MFHAYRSNEHTFKFCLFQLCSFHYSHFWEFLILLYYDSVARLTRSFLNSIYSESELSNKEAEASEKMCLVNRYFLTV
jgi:hypothetical protein